MRTSQPTPRSSRGRLATSAAAAAVAAITLTGCGAAHHARTLATPATSHSTTVRAAQTVTALDPQQVSQCLTAGGDSQDIHTVQDQAPLSLVRLAQTEGLGSFEGQYANGPGAIDEFFFGSHSNAEQALAHTDPQWTNDPGSHVWSRVIDNDIVIDRGEYSDPGEGFSSPTGDLTGGERAIFEQCHDLPDHPWPPASTTGG